MAKKHGRPLLLHKLAGATALQVAVYFTVREISRYRGAPVGADDVDIYRGFCASPRAVRTAILWLVERGYFKAGDGYLSCPPVGGA